MAENNKKRTHLLVSGRVQGVFFRDSAHKKAKELGLTGWVKNLANGQVEAVFEGDEAASDEMIAWFRQGPAFAKVDDFKIIEDDYRGDFKDFGIKS